MLEHLTILLRYEQYFSHLLNICLFQKEVVFGNFYDEKCDVFSFAMVMFEVLTNKLNPWVQGKLYVEYDMAHDPNFRPVIPPDCYLTSSMQWYVTLMKKCWEHVPSNRPSFSEILDELNRNLV